MSVINQMLKDLDERTVKNSNNIHTMSEYYQSLQAKHLIKKSTLITGLLCAGLILAADIYVVTQHLNKKNYAPQTLAPAFLPSQSPTEIVAVDQTPALASLMTLSLQTQNQMTFLQLQFSGDVLYRVNNDPTTGVTSLIFENVHLEHILAPINYTGSALKTIQVLQPSDHVLKLLLYPQEGSTLQQLNFDSQHSIFQMSYSSVPTHPAVTQLSPPRQLNVSEIISRVNQLTQQHQFSAADQLLDSGLKHYPREIQFIILKAKLAVYEGQDKQAVSLLEKYAPLLEKNPDYYAFLAALYQRQKQPRMAMRLYRQLLILQPHHAPWWVGLGIALDAMDKHNAALEAYDEATRGEGLTPVLSNFIENQLHPF